LRGRSQDAPQLAGARRVGPVPRSQQEVLALGRRIVAQRPRVPGIRKTIIGIRPGGRLIGVTARRGGPCGQAGQPEAAALADPRERLVIPPELERDLIRLPGPVTAGDGDNRKNRAIDTT
jgi:hypothetical protein